MLFGKGVFDKYTCGFSLEDVSLKPVRREFTSLKWFLLVKSQQLFSCFVFQLVRFEPTGINGNPGRAG